MSTQKLNLQKGFTLLELLVVIAILAVLAAVTVVVINPAELLARARDSQRMGDLSATRTSIALLMVDVPGTSLGPTCSPTHAFIARAPASLTGWTASTTPSQMVNGTGWIPVNLTLTAGGSPLAAYPVDPTNNANHFYMYACRTSPAGFTLIANLESIAFSGHADRLEGRDGGFCNNLYEYGTIAQYHTGASLGTLFGVPCNV